MGVKTQISLKDLPEKYQNFELIPTKNGVRDSVYLLGDKYVLKIFEDKNYSLKSEITLLNYIRELNTIQFVEEFKIYKKQVIVYKKIAGASIPTPDISHIKQLSEFLKEFHTITTNKTSKNQNIFEYDKINLLIQNRGNKLIQAHFEKIDIKLKNNGIIHGDIFPDNVLFLDGKLSGVLDFSEACNGDFLFDLAVVAISWCFDENKLNNKKINTLLQNYDKNINKAQFLEYMKYALICYSIFRYIDNRDYKQLLTKLEEIEGLA